MTKDKSRYHKYLASTEWAEIKIDLIQNRGMKCEYCGISYTKPSFLQVHHLTYKRIFNEIPSDLVLLCGRCHYAQHFKKKKKRKKSNKPIDKMKKLENYWKKRDCAKR